MRKIFLLSLIFTLLMGGYALAQEESLAISHGPISGEVTDTSVVLWARGGQAGKLLFELSTDENFDETVAGEVLVGENSDFTGETRFTDLSPATEYFYRVTLEADGSASEAKQGTFKTAPAGDESAGFKFLFGACLGGQGYCRNPDEGWRIFETMLNADPDFFLFTGDTVYTDSACPSDEGQNVPGAEEIANDLTSYRARYRYHLEDAHYSTFLANVPVYVTWDDHEILDNFGGVEMTLENPDMFNEGRQAFFEYWPIHGTDADPYQLYRQIDYGAHADLFVLDTRSYRDPLVNWDPSPRTWEHKTMLGEAQFAWLTESLTNSDATWKFIVSSVPLIYPTGFPQPEVDGRDGWANGADRSGYEHELMKLMFYLETHDIENVIFITGDTHWPYAAALDPDADGEPNVYEFSSSPLSAIPLAPANPDLTFNPEILYAEGEFQGSLFNFGEIEISEDGTLIYRTVDIDGVVRYELTLEPR